MTRPFAISASAPVHFPHLQCTTTTSPISSSSTHFPVLRLVSKFSQDGRYSNKDTGEARPRRGFKQSRQCTSITPLCKETEARPWQRQSWAASQDGQWLFQFEPAGAEPVRGDTGEDDAGPGDAEGEQHREGPAMAAPPALGRLQRDDTEPRLPADRGGRGRSQRRQGDGQALWRHRGMQSPSTPSSELTPAYRTVTPYFST